MSLDVDPYDDEKLSETHGILLPQGQRTPAEPFAEANLSADIFVPLTVADSFTGSSPKQLATAEYRPDKSFTAEQTEQDALDLRFCLARRHCAG